MSKTIELTQVVSEPRRKTIKIKMAILAIKLTVACGVAVALTNGLNIIYDRALGLYTALKADVISNLTKVQVIKEYVKPEERPLEELIEQVANELKIPAIALQAVVEKESAGGKALYRFEPEVFNRRQSIDRGSEDERRMLASSHGVGHVMGFNAKPRCNIEWSKLYDTYTGLSCGAKILRQNLDRYKEVRDPAARLRLAFRDYNGSGDMAERYANDAMAKVGALLIQQLKIGKLD